MNKENYDEILTKLAFAPVVIVTDTTTNGIIIDTMGFEAATFDLVAGIVTLGTVTMAIYESDDSGMAGETAIAGDFLVGAYATLSTTDAINSVGAVFQKRYARVKVTSAGVANLAASVTAVLGYPHNASTRD